MPRLYEIKAIIHDQNLNLDEIKTYLVKSETEGGAVYKVHNHYYIYKRLEDITTISTKVEYL